MKTPLFLAIFSLITLPAAAQVTELEINQAIGKQFKGAAHFVAGKQTIVRAFLGAPAAIDAAQTSLLVERNGQRVTQLAPRSYEAPASIVEFPCPSREDCGGWAEGEYRFTVRVNGAQLVREGVAFVKRQPLRILARPVLANYGGRQAAVTGDRWKRAVSYLQSVYPLAAEDIQWDVKDEFNGTEFDIETDAGRLSLWQALTNLQPEQCAANRRAAGCYDLIVGFIQERPGGTLQGYTYGAPTNLVVASDDDMEATVAHEIAHIYGAGDTYEGGSLNCPVNPAPDGFSGKDFNNPEATAVCREGKKTFPGASATFIGADEARAFDVGGRGAIGDYACFMGSGGKASDYWVSPEVYSRLFLELDPAKFRAAQRKEGAGRLQAGTPERVLHFSGFLSKSGKVQKDTWYTFLTADPVTDAAGDYSFKVLNAAGATIASQRFDVRFTVNSNPPRALDSAPFDGAVRVPDEAAKLVIQDKAGQTLWESAIAKSDPEVSAITPTTATLDGPQRLTWTARQPADASATLQYMVEYTNQYKGANTEWFVLAADLTKPEYAEDFDELPGGPDARLRIWATDGIRAGIAESQAFAVKVKAPFIWIDEATPATIKRGADLSLSALVEDLQDDALPDAKIEWTSSIAGRLGTGTDIVAKNLAAGEHVITLTATNSFGVSASATVKVRVE